MYDPRVYVGLSCCIIPVCTMLVGAIQVAKSWGKDSHGVRNGVILVFGSIVTTLILLWLTLYAIPVATHNAISTM